MNIPQKHQAVMPYYMVASATRFIDFTMKTFNAEVVTITKLSDDSDAIIHGEIQIGGSTVMFADASPASVNCDETCHDPENPNPSTIQLFVYVDNADDVHKKAIDAGSVSAMDVSDQGDARMGDIIDPFGNLWWIKSVKRSLQATRRIRSGGPSAWRSGDES